MPTHGLLDTYKRPLSTRGPVACALSGLLIVSYLLLYFGAMPRLGIQVDVLERVARAIGLESKWRLSALLYTSAMLLGGVHFLARHGHSRYQLIRTATVVGVQVVFGFSLPLVMRVFTGREYYFSYFWPLKIDLYPGYILQRPFLIRLYSFFGSLLAFPVLAYFLGKRFYCSWICGGGGLANTAGEPFRHLSDKAVRAWKIEQVSIHAVLVLAIAATAVVWINWAVGEQHPVFAAFAFQVQEWYGFVVGAMFAGVLGVGLYPSWARASGAASAVRWPHSLA